MSRKYEDYGIGETAEITGLTLRQLRYYEAMGYIPATERIVCGDRAYRRYKTDHIELLKTIKQYLNAGYKLDAAADKARKEIEKGGSDNGNKKK